MNVTKIPVNKVKVPETRVTAVYDEELTRLLKDTMTSVGMVQPIVVVAVGEEYHLVDGLHRLQETVAQGKTEIDAVVYAGEAKDALLLNLVTNHTRGKTRASELVKCIGALFKDYGMSLDQIAEKTGFSLDYVNKLLKVATTHPAVLDLLDREIIGVGHAYEIARLPDPRQQDELAAKQGIWRYTVKELHSFIDRVLEEMERIKNTPAAPSPKADPKYYCEVCKDEVDQRNLRPVMICPDCFGIVYRAAKEKRDAAAAAAESPAEPGGA